MPTSPQLRRFANECGRVYADSLEQSYENAKRYRAEYALIAAEVAAVLGETLEDGSALDGRKRIVGQHLADLDAAAGQAITWFEAGSPSRITLIRRMTVNGGARF